MKIIAALLLCTLCGCSKHANADDIALNKSYSYSEEPNYDFTSPDAAHTLLTDGNYTSSFFWTTKTTVGWKYKKRVSIEIDLSKEQAVGSLSFNTAAGQSGVMLPKNVLVFLSLDKIHYQYVGDAKALTSAKDNNGYQIVKLVKGQINRRARFVKLVIIPNGDYLFCDEIEVASDNAQPKPLQDEQLTTDLDGFVNQYLKKQQEGIARAFQVSRVNAAVTKSAAGSNDQSDESNLSKALATRLKSLQTKFGAKIIIDRINPWSVVTYPYMPAGNIDSYNSNITVANNGTQYGAFVITNLSSTTKTFFCSTIPAKNLDINLYIVPFVTSGKNYMKVADPLKPGNSTTIDPGESSMFFYSVFANNSGSSQFSIKITTANYSNTLTTKVNVTNTHLANDGGLNADNWAYLNAPLLKGRENKAIDDLLKHHINTMTVPPSVLPSLENPNFEQFSQYLTKVKSFKNILLFLDFTSAYYKQSFSKYQFPSDAWKNLFSNWLNKLLATASTVGVQTSQLYIYAYDEPKDNDIDQYKIFLQWMKAQHPNVKTFGTIATDNASKALKQLLAIQQLTTFKSIAGNAQTWFYGTSGNAELLPAYNYYRLMSWKAFYNNYTGVGFWNYADYRNGTNDKTDLTNFEGVSSTNYSVVYIDNDQILSSKRWEAFKLGLEDYKVLKLYAAKKGLDAAKKVALNVINQPQRIGSADVEINKMLLELE